MKKLAMLTTVFFLFFACATERNDTNAFVDPGCETQSEDQNPERLPWTLVVIPDTQHYTANWGKAPYERMDESFKWIAENVGRLNIKMVQGLGDITENWSNGSQWARGKRAWEHLRGKVLYMPVAGNHDSLDSFNQHFPLHDFDGLPWFGGNHNGTENIFFNMDLGGVDYLFLQLQSFDPYSDPNYGSLNWAKEILLSYPDHKVILATHDIWSSSIIREQLLRHHENIVLSNGGHSCVREAYYKENNSHSFVVDYQCDSNEVFFLRYYTFYPEENKVRYYTYSPVLNQYETDAESQGEFSLQQ